MSEELPKSPMSEAVRPGAPKAQKRTGWAELANGDTVELAGRLRRLGARWIDNLIMGVVASVLFVVFWTEAELSDDVGTVSIGFMGILVPIVVVVTGCEVVQTAVWGRTVGKRMTGIKVIDAAHGGAPGWSKSLRRLSIPGLSWLILFIVFGWRFPSLIGMALVNGWFLVLLDKMIRHRNDLYQGWHDRVAGTLVIKQ